jgi:hypothetical protein
MATDIIRADVSSRKSFHVWTLGHYVKVTESNYLKQLQIIRIVEQIDAGASDDQFFIAAHSADLYGEVDVARDSASLVVLAEKRESADEFWSLFERLRRPEVFYRSHGGLREKGEVAPLYSSVDPEALKIIQASVSTPITITFEGDGKVLRQIFYGRDDERRAQEVPRCNSITSMTDHLSPMRERISATGRQSVPCR